MLPVFVQRLGFEAVSRGVVLLVLASVVACKRPDPREQGKKVFHMALSAKVSSLDPVQGNTVYSSLAQSAGYEPILRYKYLRRPLTLEPQLLTRMPDVDESETVYNFELKPGIRFQDDPCFKNGRGRELVAEDVLYSMKRMADPHFQPKGWWIYQARIQGFDAYKEAETAHGGPFNYDVPVPGLVRQGRYRFQIRLVKPYPQFLYVLAHGYTAVVPREAVEYYGAEFGRHMVSTGPFVLESWVPGTKLVYHRNPNFREAWYPSPRDATAEAYKLGLVRNEAAKIPFLDGIVMHVYEQSQPMWLKWRVKDLDFISAPAEYQASLFDASWALRPQFREEGIGTYPHKALDFIYKGFNMLDPVVGGFGPGKYLRQAIFSAMDTQEIADAFYNNAVIHYDGPIPPGLDGHDSSLVSPFRGPKLEAAKALLARAGYPAGKGLPPIRFHTSRSGNNREQAEMLRRQLRRIGVELETHFHSFPDLDDRLKKKKAQMFGLGWVSDYPDAENNLALFYGPNASPGSNNFNYRRADYDALYEKARTMKPSKARTTLYQQMRDMIIEDCPAVGGMARVTFYVWNKRVRSMRPDDMGQTWLRYVDVLPR